MALLKGPLVPVVRAADTGVHEHHGVSFAGSWSFVAWLPMPAFSLCLCRELELAGAAMADADDVRRLALALPHVQEIDSDGFDFRVGGKGFVWSYPEREPGKRRVIRTDIAVLFVGDEAEKQALLLGEPGLFFTTPAYNDWPLVMLRLAEVDVERLAELVTDAWRMRAPAALARDLGDTSPLPDAESDRGRLP
jgi:hypothetical protein